MLVDFALVTDRWVKVEEGKKLKKYLDLTWELKKFVEYEDDDGINYSWSLRNSPRRSGKETELTKNLRKNWDCADHSTTEII